MIIRRPISEEQRQKMGERLKPTSQEILKAQDELFMNVLTRLAELESKTLAKRSKKS